LRRRRRRRSTYIELIFCDFDLRRGLVDMRKLFRGNAHISASKELGEGGKSASPQLYAGKPAFQSVGGEEVQMEPEKTRG
jgi:cytochrome c oxidase assembly factor 5